jgi:hypothetical protein
MTTERTIAPTTLAIFLIRALGGLVHGDGW